MARLAKNDVCIKCSKPAYPRYTAMKEWKMDGILCGVCYSKLISDHYEGDHIRLA